MDTPIMREAYQAAPDTVVLPSFFPIPGLGILAVNAFVLRAAEPVLVDTGLVPLSDEFMEQLTSVIDLADLRWLWLTHTDQDHVGSLRRILELAPNVRVITTYLGVGKMSLFQPLPLDRVHLLNPGQSIDVGDRTLTAVKPPTWDAPETTGLFDARTGVLFSADCFGALLSEPVMGAADLAAEDLERGLLLWTTVDAPWLHAMQRDRFAATLERVRELSPQVVLSAHLPPAPGMADQLLGLLPSVPDMSPFVGPDQPALEAMLAGLRGQ